MLARNRCYEALSTLEQKCHRTTVFIVNFVIVILLLILSIFLIAGFDISYFSRF